MKNKILMVLIAVLAVIFFFSWFRQTKQSTSSLLDQKIDIEGWKVTDLEENVHLVADLVKDKPVFVNIWASWCGPCVYEMPSIQKLYEKYKDDIVFLCFSNEDLDDIRDFINRRGFNIPVYQSKKQPRQFNVNAIPATFILSKEKVTRYEHIGYKDWNQKKIHELIETLR